MRSAVSQGAPYGAQVRSRTLDPVDLICAIALAGLWLVTRPYRGVRHDAVLYLGQTLNRLMPDRFHSDLFFAFGSQDKYSLFSPMFAPLVARFGVAASEVVVLVLCHAAFLAACWLLIRDWPTRLMRWAALMMVAVLPHTYGGLGAFSFAEPFLTGRSLAEPLALLALWQLLEGRIVLAVCFAVVGMAFHPLIVLPVVVISWIYLVLGDRRWATAAVLMVIPAALGAAGVAPFAGMWQSFDPAWWSAIVAPNKNAFVGNYQLLDWAPVVFDVVVAWSVIALRPSERLARFVRATLIAVAVLTGAWGIGADLLHNVLLTQLQLWRVYWPLHLIVVLALPWVVVNYARRGPTGQWAAMAIVLAGVAVMSNWKTGWLCVAWALAAMAAVRHRANVSAGIARLATLGCALGVVAISWKVARLTLRAVVGASDRFNDPGIVLIFLGLSAVGLLLSAAILASLHAGGRWRIAGASLAAFLVAYGTAHWDQRSAWQRRIEHGLDGPPIFGQRVGAGQTLFWGAGGMLPAWMLAQHGLYYNPGQGAGLLFNRGTALAFQARSEAFAGMDLQHELCETINLITMAKDAADQACPATLPTVVDACRATDHPDFVVLDGPLPVAPLAEWRWRSADGRESKRYDLYRCADLH